MVLVRGTSGVGKSALVSELHKPLTLRRGHFVDGKYDQYKRNIPYSAISQALDAFCGLLLAETETSLAEWRLKIRRAVGDNAQLLVDVIPALELLLGPQPPVAKLPPQETTNRFLLVFQRFIAAISREEHPLVLFLDDLQWADSASLNLLKALLTDAGEPLPPADRRLPRQRGGRDPPAGAHAGRGAAGGGDAPRASTCGPCLSTTSPSSSATRPTGTRPTPGASPGSSTPRPAGTPSSCTSS